MDTRLAPSLRKTIAIAYGALCHACFVVGVGTMVVMMYFGMSRSLGTLEPPSSWLANAALLAQFPIMHSFLLTEKGRAVLGRLAPMGAGAILSTTSYVTIAALQVFALFAFWSPSETIWWQAEGSSLAVMSGLYALAWLLLGKAMADAGLTLQSGLLGWWALLRNKKSGVPEDAGERTVSSVTAAHLCHIHSHAVDRAYMDARPAHRCRDAHALLSHWTALQGGPLPTHLWAGLRGLLPTRALLATVAAAGRYTGQELEAQDAQ